MTVLRADYVLPIDQPPLYKGELVIDGDLIVEVRPQTKSEQCSLDFGDAILMPGFVNVHSHLELSVLRGLNEDLPFFPWVRRITHLKSLVPQESWLDSSRLGAAEALASGITFVGDCTDTGTPMQACHELGLRGVIYQETFGVLEPLEPDKIIAHLEEKLHLHHALEAPRLEVAVSPHAPYTVRPPLLQALARRKQQKSWKLAIHASESRAEMDSIRDGSGPFGDMYRDRQIPWQPSHSTPIAHLDRFGALTPDTLLIHCVHLEPSDYALIAEKGSAIAHCPKSNAKLGDGIAPLCEMLSHQIPLGIGTDGVISNNRLDMFEEMREAIFLQRATRLRCDELNARTLLEIATLGGAKAMQKQHQIGSLAPGKQADVCAISLQSPRFASAADPHNALVYAATASDVSFTMVAGEPLYDNGCWLRMDIPAVSRRVRDASRQVRQQSEQE